jgi:signal transduction histidine kinase
MKLTIAFSLMALLPLTIMGASGLWITTRSLEDNAVAQVQHYVDLVKLDVQALLERTQRDLEYLERLDGFSEFTYSVAAGSPPRTERMSAAIIPFCRSHPVYFQIRFLTLDGEELLRVVDLGDGSYTSLPPRDELSGARFYLHALEDRRDESIVAVPVELKHPRDPRAQVSAVSFMRPSTDTSGEQLGIWVADLFAERLLDLLQRPPVVPGGELVFCDAQGHYLYHPSKKKEWRQLLATRATDNLHQEWGPRVAAAILSGDEGMITGAGRDIVAYTSVWKDPSNPERGYILYYRIPAAVAFAPARQFVWVFALLGVLTLFLILAAAYLGAGQLSRPLLALSRGARVIAGGNFEHRIRVVTNDEIETVADDFNRMANAMAERDRVILEHEEKLNEYAVGLEEMVELRTAKLRDSQRLLARSKKMAAVGKLAAGIAHEVNNPIGIILNRIETMLAERGDSDDTLREDLTVLARHAKRVGMTTEDLLRFARPRELSRHTVDLRDSCRSVVALIRPEYERRGVVLDFESPEHAVAVVGDPDRLEQVVLNLLDNALDVSAHRQTVNLRLEAAGSHARIEIVDRGCGIAPEDLEQIFDPFYTTKEVGQGSGLGLTITNELVREHGGTIMVESTIGTGTTFAVEIPLHSK